MGIILVVGNDIKMIAHREIAEKNVRAVSEMGTAALEDFPLTINDNLKSTPSRATISRATARAPSAS